MIRQDKKKVEIGLSTTNGVTYTLHLSSISRSIVGVPAPVTKVIGPDTDPVCVQRNVYMMYV